MIIWFKWYNYKSGVPEVSLFFSLSSCSSCVVKTAAVVWRDDAFHVTPPDVVMHVDLTDDAALESHSFSCWGHAYCSEENKRIRGSVPDVEGILCCSCLVLPLLLLKKKKGWRKTGRGHNPKTTRNPVLKRKQWLSGRLFSWILKALVNLSRQLLPRGALSVNAILSDILLAETWDIVQTTKHFSSGNFAKNKPLKCWYWTMTVNAASHGHWLFFK